MTFKSLWMTCVRVLITSSWLIGMMATAGALATWFTIKSAITRKVIEVPDFCGLPMDRAQSQATENGLILEVNERTLHNNVVGKDQVLYQTPNPGKKIKAGRTVVLTLSAGPESKKIPSLMGEPLNFAEILSAQADTEITKISRTFSQQRKGRIVDQHPSAGEEIGVDPGISVLISEGDAPTWYVTPDFRGKDFAEVKRFLDEHGFRVVAKFKDIEPGWGQVIMRQIPQAGYPVNSDQTITLEVNKD